MAMRSHAPRCFACKRSKVKCDGAKPSCGRCTNSGKACPGYSDELFVDMNQTSKERALKLRFKRSKFAESSQSKTDQNDRADLINFAEVPAADSPGSQHSDSLVVRDTKTDAATLPVPLAKDWKQQALHLFFHDYVANDSLADAYYSGYLSFLPQLYQNSPSNLPLGAAVEAAALAHLGNKAGLDWLKYRAKQSYGKSIGLLRDALNDPKLAVSDEALASLWMVQKYEQISGDLNPIQMAIHDEGQIALLRLRGNKRLKTPVERALFLLISSRQQTKEAGLRLKPTLGVMRLTPEIGEDLTLTHPGEVFYDSFGLRSSEVMATIAGDLHEAQCCVDEVKSSNGTDLIALENLREHVRHLMTIDAEIQSWHSLYREHMPRVIQRESLPGGGKSLPHPTYPRKVHLYTILRKAGSWTRIWTVQIFNLQMIKDCMTTLSRYSEIPDDLPSDDTIRRIVLEVADHIIANVPAAVGEIDKEGNPTDPLQSRAVGTYFLLWSLGVLVTLPEIDDPLAEWLIGYMTYMGNAHGLQSAFIVRESMVGLRTMKQLEPAPSKYRELI